MVRNIEDTIQLIKDLKTVGVTIEMAGKDRLRLRPRHVFTPELVERVKRHKPALINLLTKERQEPNTTNTNTETPPEGSAKRGFGSGVAGVGADAKPDIDAIIEREVSRPRPPFPTPEQWIRGHGITWESVGFERYQFGGRPHCLRNDLRRLWLDEYVTSKQQGYSEPAAWDRAWQAVHESD